MKLIIFDLDGTLVNSLDDLADAANFALDKLGYPIHDVEKYKYFVGDGIPKLIERILHDDKCSEKNIQEVNSEFDNRYREHYLDKTVPYDGIKSLLVELKKCGCKLAVATNKPDEFAQNIVIRLFGDVFDKVIGKRDFANKKPDPDIIYEIMDTLSCCKEDTVMIGDSNVDVYTAQNAGICSIGCLWGFRKADELIEAGADCLVSSPTEILKCI